MKVVLDTNVLLAGFATRGLCEAVVSICLDHHVTILSQVILHETAEHLVGKFKLPAAMVRERVAFLRDHAEMVEPALVPTDACRDPEDLPILGTALAGSADCLITGDAVLLTLGSYRGIPILSPRAFHDRLRCEP